MGSRQSYDQKFEKNYKLEIFYLLLFILALLIFLLPYSKPHHAMTSDSATLISATAEHPQHTQQLENRSLLKFFSIEPNQISDSLEVAL
jgi:hypothetical protein